MGKTVSAEKLYMHPDYTTRHDWDFCLIKLSKALEFDCKVEPIGRVSIKNTRNSLFLRVQNQSRRINIFMSIFNNICSRYFNLIKNWQIRRTTVYTVKGV